MHEIVVERSAEKDLKRFAAEIRIVRNIKIRHHKSSFR